MLNINNLPAQLFANHGSESFNALALDLFRLQAAQNPVYRGFLEALKVEPSNISRVEDIPFLPISFFKQQTVVTGQREIEQVFTSSGTTGMITSQHHVADVALYEASFTAGFERFYGPVSDYCVLALLPAYLERSGSSLVHMANAFIAASAHPESGFYLNELDELADTLERLDKSGTKVLLLGVTFALLDMAEHFRFQLKNTVVMETGGMKGRRKEMIREEVHSILCAAFGVAKIHSEYGMTELLSQAWSDGAGKFSCPPWMNVLVREPSDPMSLLPNGRTGGLNIIDFANVWSCAFIATQDLGRQYSDGSFEVLGRFDHSDLRGCSLLTA